MTTDDHLTHDGEVAPNAERHPDALQPRIYVASLADYNAGRLHGVWLDADDELEDLHAGIDAMLANSIEDGAEEYAIHDFDGFGAFRVSEYDTIGVVSKIAQGIRDQGAAFSHWADHVGTSDPDELDRFEDHYLGRWDSTEAFVEELIDDFGINRMLDEIPTPWRYYIHIDTKTLARDLESDYVISEDGDGIYLFEP